MDSFFQRVLEVQTRVQDQLLSKQNVVGVAVGYRNADKNATDEPAVVALVERKLPKAALTADDMVPNEIQGVRTDVYEVGYLQAQQTPVDRFRPVIPAGVSMAHYKVTAGTLGAVVKDRTTGEILLLSNNHVFANSNEAIKGDAILQPSPMDGGKNPGDLVAHLERFITLNYLEGPVGGGGGDQPDPTPDPKPDPVPDPGGQPGGSGCDLVELLVGLSNILAKASGSERRVAATTAQAQAATRVVAPAQTKTAVASAQAATNLIDAALARPLNPDMFSGEIQQIGMITGSAAPMLGMNIRKHGRTTGFTTGMVTLLNATVSVNYLTSAGHRTARFTGQVISTPMSQAGDSGSLIVEANSQNAVGLLFAGSDRSTIFTPISVVLNALNIMF